MKGIIFVIIALLSLGSILYVKEPQNFHQFPHSISTWYRSLNQNNKYPPNINPTVVQQGTWVLNSLQFTIRNYFRSNPNATVFTMNKYPIDKIVMVQREIPHYYALYSHKLGQGANGWVFLAQDIDTREFLAVKQQPALENTSYIKNEIEQLSILNRYRGEMSIKGFEIETHYLFSQLLPGTCIEELYSSDMHYNTKEILDIILASFYALRKLHANRIVHNDIYEGNIIYNVNDKKADWVDLGLSLWLPPGVSSKITNQWAQRLAPSHKAPEYNHEKGYATDVHSLGIMSLRLFLILTEQDPILKTKYIKSHQESFIATQQKYSALSKGSSALAKIYHLLLQMTSEETEARPTLDEAIAELEQTLKLM